MYWLIPLILLLLLALLFGGAYYIDRVLFGKRSEGNPNLKYLTAEDFEHLSADPVEFPSDRGQLLRGFLYRSTEQDACRALAVFAHGIGGGHQSYTTEINTLAQNGFLVLAYDQTGTLASEGKNLRGFTQGVLDLRAALRFAREDSRTSALPVVLVGHSWGGFTVCQALRYAPEVKAVAALSGFENEADLVCALGGAQIGFPLAFLKPFYRVIQRIKFGGAANRRTSAVLKEAGVPALLLHGEKDAIVPLEKSAAAACAEREAFPSVRCVCYPEKFHNVYQSLDSEAYLNEVFGKIRALQGKSARPEELDALYRSIDYEKITEEDPEVMRTVLDFLNERIS